MDSTTYATARIRDSIVMKCAAFHPQRPSHPAGIDKQTAMMDMLCNLAR